MAQHNDIGIRGEQLAQQYLIREGYEVLESNWRSGKAEIDIIVQKEEVLIFVEVKTRTNTHFGQPEDFIDTKKINFLTSAAGDYMREINHEWEVRFDIISVVLRDKNEPFIKHIKDAFFIGLK